MNSSASAHDGGHAAPAAAAELGGSHHDDEFYSLTMLLVFLLATWVVGKAAMKVKIPSLLGEMVVGMVLGPNLLDVVPFPNALVLVGEVGLLLLVLEAGLEVDLQLLKRIGVRGLIVAVVGSMVPLGLGVGIAMGIQKMEVMEALAVGASLSPTSMAIALNILKVGKSLQTPSGQLIIAAAVIDDVIALILLSELKALQGTPSALAIATPIISSIAFIAGIGGFAIFAMPRIMKRVENKSETFITLCVFGMFTLSIGLMNATYYGQSSFLLGAFLAGMVFCTLPQIKEVWHSQVKRIETWMLRLFFSTTIAFKVPVRDLWDPKVLTFTAALLIPLLGKMVTGVFAPRPLTKISFCIIGFAMSAWGEFAFVVANTSLELGIMSQETFASVVLAVLISAIVSPWALSLTLLFSRKQKEILQYQVEMGVRKRRGARHAYLEVDICCLNRWGLIDGLISTLSRLDLSVCDFTVTSIENFSVMRLYVWTRAELAATESELAYIQRVEQAVGEYCGISRGEEDSDFGFLPPSPIPSAVFRREDFSDETIFSPGQSEIIFSDLYPALNVKRWQFLQGSREGESVRQMQSELDKFNKRCHSARKLGQIRRSKSLAAMQSSIIRSAQSSARQES